MNKDQLVLEEMYMQMYDEKLNWKHALGGLGALGVGALGYSAMNHKPAEIKKHPTSQHSRDPHPIPPPPHLDEVSFENAKTTKDLKKLIRNYYQSSGQDVDVSIMGGNVDLFNRSQNKKFSFPLKDLTGSIKMGKDEDNPAMPYRFLDTWVD